MGFFWKNHTTGHFDGKTWRKQANPFAINGVPDIIGCSKAGVLFFEVKTKEGKLSKAQNKFAKSIEPFGARVYVLRGYQDALVALKHAGFASLELSRDVATDLLSTYGDLNVLQTLQTQGQENLMPDLKIL